MRSMKTVPIFGVHFAKIDLKKAVKKVKHWVEKGGRYQVTTLNPEYLLRVQEDQALRQVVDKADLVVADGTGIILASWLIDIRSRIVGIFRSGIGEKKTPLVLFFKNRITGGDLVEALARLAAQESWKVGLIGGAPGVADKALIGLKNLVLYSPLKSSKILSNLIGFADSGPENVKKQTREEFRRIKQLLFKERPQILFTSFGFYGPIWIEKALKALQNRGKSLVAIEVGGVFNYLAGLSSRPPKLIRQIGLEWLWRLIHEPWRIKRQMKLLKFVWLVVKSQFQKESEG